MVRFTAADDLVTAAFILSKRKSAVLLKNIIGPSVDLSIVKGKFSD